MERYYKLIYDIKVDNDQTLCPDPEPIDWIQGHFYFYENV